MFQRIAAKLTIPYLAGILVLLTCGCSSFNRDWRSAARPPAEMNSMEGRWEGKWKSDVNGHSGRLLCVVSRKENGSHTARFRATYMRVLRFSYAVSLRSEHLGGNWHFSGDENLGKLAGGEYHYEGSVTATDFNASYQSKYDHGLFEMKRP